MPFATAGVLTNDVPDGTRPVHRGAHVFGVPPHPFTPAASSARRPPTLGANNVVPATTPLASAFGVDQLSVRPATFATPIVDSIG